MNKQFRCMKAVSNKNSFEIDLYKEGIIDLLLEIEPYYILYIVCYYLGDTKYSGFWLILGNGRREPSCALPSLLTLFYRNLWWMVRVCVLFYFFRAVSMPAPGAIMPGCRIFRRVRKLQ